MPFSGQSMGPGQSQMHPLLQLIMGMPQLFGNGNPMLNSFTKAMNPRSQMPGPNQMNQGGFGQSGAIGGTPYGMYGAMFSGVGPGTQKSAIGGPKA